MMVDSRGLKTFSVRLTPDQHRQLKILSAYRGETVRDLIISWLEHAWQEHEETFNQGGKKNE